LTQSCFRGFQRAGENDLDAGQKLAKIGVLGNLLLPEVCAMSTRERWIVYPLLFLTLGIALRDKVIPPVQFGHSGLQVQAGEIAAHRIGCAELRVGRVLCDRLEAKQADAMALLVNGPKGQPVVAMGTDPVAHAGTVETFTVDGVRQVRLHSTPGGGMVSTVGRAGRLVLAMGDLGQGFGVFAELPEIGKLIPLTTPWRFDVSPKPKEPPKGASPEPKSKQPPQKPKSEPAK
jgi:hypothetical protein